MFGFDTAVISGAETTLQSVFELGDWAHGFTVATALIGTIIGAMTIGKPADILGRRAALFMLATFYLVSAAGSALAWDWYSFVIFRFIGGLGVGGASVVSPMYVAEISPARLRGRLVAIVQLNIVVGILAAFFSNYFIAWLELGTVEWRWMFGAEAFPALTFLALLCVVPRSPRWLVAEDLIDEAREVLSHVGTDTGELDAEIEAIEESLQERQEALREPFFQRKYLGPILLAVAIAMFNQLSGINAVMYFAPRIFEMAGTGEETALLQTVAVGGTNLMFTLFAMSIIDKVGRKKLMIAGSLGYILSLATAAVTFTIYGTDFTGIGGSIVLCAIIAFVASHAFGQGAVIWVFISEIFPNRVRARGQSLGTFTHWVFAAAVSWTFPAAAAYSASLAFYFFCGMMVLQLLWVLLIMPETKGVPLEKIREKLGIKE